MFVWWAIVQVALDASTKAARSVLACALGIHHLHQNRTWAEKKSVQLSLYASRAKAVLLAATVSGVVRLSRTAHLHATRRCYCWVILKPFALRRCRLPPRGPVVYDFGRLRI
jgi:hypothetical protein